MEIIQEANHTDSYLQSAMFTKVVLAFGDHWINEWLPANEAGKGQLLLIMLVLASLLR